MDRLLRNILLFFSTVLFSLNASAQSSSFVVEDRLLQQDWQIQSSGKVAVGGEHISTESFRPESWYATTVPHTVLGALADDSVFKNIFYDRNLEKIPDSLFAVPWWYRTSFRLVKPLAGQVYRLRFNGISYRADIWMNGKKIASADTLDGSFRQFTLDISPYVREGANVLALKVTRAKGGELNVGFVDWNPEPADHNMGIWRDVHLLVSGPVSIEEPFVQTAVDTATLDHADISLSVLLHNHAARAVNGLLDMAIGKDIHVSKKISLAAGKSRKIILSSAEYAALSMDHPKLWWTHTLGKPHLYELHLQFTENGRLSDSSHIRFGIRTVSGYMTKEGFRAYRLNGKKLLIRGGGWTDPMLLNASPAYEEAGIDYAVHQNLNAIRMEGFWGHDQHLYDLCDEKGILVMVGFSCQWEWKNSFGTDQDDQYGAIMTPEQIDMAAASWHDQLTWLRNHPSIFLWLYGSDKWPRPALEKKYLAVLKDVDTTRPYVQSAQEHVSEITGPTGMKMRGPYDYVPPDYWYVDTAYGGAFGFNTETGPGPQVPVLESLKKMIPADSLWPISSAWMYHAARGQFHNLARYNQAMDRRLGEANNLTDYLRKAQYLNYEGMRAMYEAFGANRFVATGIIQWMYNASWPKLWWQLYDYYLMPTAAFYGARKANEPVHISYNYGKNAVDIMNNTLEDKKDLQAEIQVLDFSLKQVLQKTIPLHELAAQHTQQVFELPATLPLSKTWFLRLQLYDPKKQVLSTNFYVLSTQKDELQEDKSTWYVTPQSRYADLTLLQQLPQVNLQSSEAITERNDTTFIQVKLKNPTTHLAFMVCLDLKKKQSDESVVPVFWEDNYFTLLPGEERTVSGYCHTEDLKGESPAITIGGWNVP